MEENKNLRQELKSFLEERGQHYAPIVKQAHAEKMRLKELTKQITDFIVSANIGIERQVGGFLAAGDFAQSILVSYSYSQKNISIQMHNPKCGTLGEELLSKDEVDAGLNEELILLRLFQIFKDFESHIKESENSSSNNYE